MRHDQRVRAAGLLTIASFCLVISGCSFIFVSGPPRAPEQKSFIKCRGSYLAPIYDLLAGLSPAFFVFLPAAYYGFTGLYRCAKAQDEVAAAIGQLQETPDGLRADVTLASVGVTLDQRSDTLRVGETTWARAAALTKAGAEIAGRLFLWGSSDAAVVSVDLLGAVSAKSPGSATIRAATGGMTGVRQVVVVP